jgi:DNA helicase II / ATP-dependent DNA helicase PcrA
VVEHHPEVVQEYRSRYGAVLLDEYQDTNIAQADLMAALFGDAFPVTAVGDPDQNIYAWRGASLYNLLDFPRRFRRADGSESECLPLYTNFRSGKRILEAADTIIGHIPPRLRPAEDKKLEPFPPNGEGEVHLVKHLDEWTEAAWIADRVLEVHRTGEPWGEIAVLCRKSRLFVPLRQALAERQIPAEFVGLGGLLKLPEVVEILSYARAVADPHANVAIARILLGPRYRVGFRDLARLGGWAAGQSKEWREILGDEADGTVSLAEAIEHLDEVDGLSDDARERLERFRDEITELRVAARRPVGEFLGEVIRRIGLLSELDAHLDIDLAAATKRNLAAFLDEVHAFSPIEGELTLRAFVDYVDAVDSLEKHEWSPVQPSEADSVKVMTVHQAKGLEFGTVFVPGFAKDLLPDYAVQQNPAEKGKSLDFELRGDRDILPTFEGNLKGFWHELRQQELYEERRTCYVALTRAKRRLFPTGAHWYGDGSTPKGASVFFDELADWAEESGRAEIDRGPDGPGSENPLAGYRERFVRDWPEPARLDDADELFPSGWRTAAVQAAGTGGVPESMLAALDAEQRAAFEALAAERQTLAAHLVERETTAAWTPSPPTTVSVSSLVDYGRCPKRFYWSAVRPLPRFSGPAARIGTEIHAWIERQAAGQATLLDLDEAPDVAPEELVGEPGRIERLQQAFLDSRFGSLVPLHVERPFLLAIEGFVVRGRIDAIFDAGEGRWEVVDYKTGSKPPDDPLTQAQLDLYALACIDVWGRRPEDLTLTYAYLASGEEVSHAVGNPADLRERVSTWLRGIASSAFEPTPSPHCRWCDFRPFCDAGQRWLAENPA